MVNTIIENEEEMIRVADIPTLPFLPKRKGGKPLAASTIYGWINAGARGIKLESAFCGAVLCTSREAVKRFFERIGTPGANQSTITTSQATRGHQDAMRRLKQLGVVK